MKIRFVDRGAFKRGIMKDEYRGKALISISDTEHEMYEMSKYVVFYEYSDQPVIMCRFPDNDTGITKEDARKVVDFIIQNEGYDFIVHCFMGVSRSGAVAKFINEYYGLDDPILNDYKMYNVQVYNALNAVIGKDLATYYAELEKEDRGSWGF